MSPPTREFARLSLDGVYGREARANYAVMLDDIPDYNMLPLQKRYDLAIQRICETAPLRITPYELVTGAATLGLAIDHYVPAVYQGQPVCQSISHYTADFPDALRRGVDAIETEVRQRLKDASLSAAQRSMIEGLIHAIDGLHIYHARYLHALRYDGSPRCLTIADALKRVPFEPPKTFREAVQALWFLFSWQRLCGNWPGLGRIDEMLGGFLECELAAGTITRDEAREILASMLIKGCEWITLEKSVSGDAQHYQNIVLGGIDVNGHEVTNTVTELTLEILEELPIGDYPVAVRINEHTPPRIFELMASNIRHGGGVIAVYNERVILANLVSFGYTLSDARRFANDGCWEIQIPGETCFSYIPFDAYGMLQRDVFHLGDDTPVDYPDFEALVSAYNACLSGFISRLHDDIDTARRIARGGMPSSVVSLLEKGSIAHARNYYDLGPRFTVVSPHIGGFPDVVNALFAVKALVYDEKRLTFREFMDILKTDWEGYEDLRLYIRRHIVFFGNDSAPADALGARLMSDYCRMVEAVHERAGILRPAGASTFGRQIGWASSRFAHAHGFRAGTYLASNVCPTPGTDTEGVSAVIRSHCTLGVSRLVCGTALDIKLSPKALTDERYVNLITGLVRGFCDSDGIFMQFDVIDDKILREAQAHPELYSNLSVRLSGWSARFVTLSQEWQDMIIERTTQNK
ncbi:MAG: pyruvate formate lyase family protein [Clostridiaceae bacterium]|nr:pyruvate formate lyase family protein [Clostridiaceae bacterium]